MQSLSILYVMMEGIIMTEGLWLNYQCAEEICSEIMLYVAGLFVPFISAFIWIFGCKLIFELFLRRARPMRKKNRKNNGGKSKVKKASQGINLKGILVSVFMAATAVIAIVTIGIYSFKFEVIYFCR